MSITTALAAQKAQFEADAAALTDTRLALEVSVLIERWYAAATMQAREEANAIQSYGVSGRQVTKRPGGELAMSVARLRSEIEACLFGGPIKVVDMRDATEVS